MDAARSCDWPAVRPTTWGSAMAPRVETIKPVLAGRKGTGRRDALASGRAARPCAHGGACRNVPA